MHPEPAARGGVLRQPTAVWATAFAVVNAHLPCYVGAGRCAVAIGILVTGRRHLDALVRVDVDHALQDAPAPA